MPVRPKKRLGQHFLTDKNIARKIAGCLSAAPDETVVEIGPGTGVLTDCILEKRDNLTIVEVDAESVTHLTEKYAGQPVKIIHADILKWDIAAELPGEAHFIGNLPYNISSPIFFRLLENRERVKSGVFMVQKEVAERIAAGPGTKTYGVLSVLMGYFYELKYAFTVPETVFFPRPKVKSGVFTMQRKTLEDPAPYKALLTVVNAAFQQRRKMLRNSIAALPFKTPEIPEKFATKRPEQLAIEDFVALANALQ